MCVKNLLNLFISSKFLVDSLGLSVYKTISPANRNLTFFVICILGLSRVYRTMLNKGDENGHPYLASGF
jgi:hypothetical protein